MATAKKTRTLAERIADAAREAFAAVRLAHPDERFYFFALYTTPDFSYVVPTAASEEGLARAIDEYVERDAHRDRNACERDLRFSAPDSPYHELEAPALAKLGGGRGLRAACFTALRSLDRDGVFGAGGERASVIINVVFGDMSDEQWLEHASELNPKEALATALPYLRIAGESGPVTRWGRGVYQVNALSFSADRSFVAYSGSGGDVGVLTTAERSSVYERRRAGEHWASALSPDGSLLYLGDREGVLTLNVATGKARRLLQSDKPSGIQVSPDGLRLVVTTYEGACHVYEAKTGAVTSSPKARARHAAFSPNGSALATLYGEYLSVHDSALNLERLRVACVACAFAWLPDGALIVCESQPEATKLVVFEAATGRRMREWETTACDDGAIAVSPSGRIALCADRTLIVLAADGRELARGTGGQESLISCGFIDDERALAVGRDVNCGPALLELAVSG